MARYAQFTAESFAARAKGGSPAGPAGGGARPPAGDAGGVEYGSLLVVRVGRPKKRPVLILDPEEAAADAVRFQEIAAHDFANPDECAARSAVVRLSALAANESGLEDDDVAEASTLSGGDADADADAALALWTNPVEPVDPSDWNDGTDEAAMAEADHPWIEPVVPQPTLFVLAEPAHVLPEPAVAPPDEAAWIPPEPVAVATEQPEVVPFEPDAEAIAPQVPCDIVAEAVEPTAAAVEDDVVAPEHERAVRPYVSRHPVEPEIGQVQALARAVADRLRAVAAAVRDALRLG